MLTKILILNFIVLVSGLQNTKVFNIHKQNNSIKNNHTRHSDLFSQYVELSFYENMNQCLNNDKNVITWHDYFIWYSWIIFFNYCIKIYSKNSK